MQDQRSLSYGLQEDLTSVPLHDSSGYPAQSYKCSPDKPSLLDLPLELRLLIYPFVFSDAVIELQMTSKGNNRRDHWFVSDRNLSRKFISGESYIRPHIWRPRSQILGSCRQVRKEVLSRKLYGIEVNLFVDDWYPLKEYLPRFLFSCITTISTNQHGSWHRYTSPLERPPSLRHFCFNRCFMSSWIEHVGDDFNAVRAAPHKCWEGPKQLAVIKSGERDVEIFDQVMKRPDVYGYCKRTGASWFSFHWFEEESKHQCSLYIRVRIAVLPISFNHSELDRGSRHRLASSYWLYPQLVLLASLDAEHNSEIVERHWRDDAGDGTDWQCLSADKQQCSCSNGTYCSTRQDNEQYCEDWFGNVTSGPAWQEPRRIADEIYPEGYCLFEN